MTWQDEARAAVAKDWWRWLPGMVGEWERRQHGRLIGLVHVAVAHHGGFTGPWTDPKNNPRPLLTHPATVGCLGAEVERLCAYRGIWVDVRVFPDGSVELTLTWRLADGESFTEESAEFCVHAETTDPQHMPAASGLANLRALTWLHEEAR